MARCWVAGATGFLGAHLSRQLVEEGHEVIPTSRHGAAEEDEAAPGMAVAAVDVADADAVEASARGCELAFLAAGKVSRDRRDAEELRRVHVLGTRNALEGLRRAGVKRVVVASTSGTLAVGEEPDEIFDEEAEPPIAIIARWPYYLTKYYAEQEALEANTPTEFEVVVVNPSLLLGPGDLRGSSTEDIKLFLEGSIAAVPAGGLAFVDVRDVAVAMVRAAEQGRAGERYLLSGCNLTVAAFFQRLARLSGVKAPWLSLPRSPTLATLATRAFSDVVERLGGEPPVDEVSVEMAQFYWYCDSAKAERELGFSPRQPGETLRDTVEDLVRRQVAFPRLAARGEGERPLWGALLSRR